MLACAKGMHVADGGRKRRFIVDNGWIFGMIEFSFMEGNILFELCCMGTTPPGTQSGGWDCGFG